MCNIGTEVLYVKGTLGDLLKPLTTTVVFSLLLHPKEKTVIGTVKINENNEVFTGKVTGKTYVIKDAKLVRIIYLQGKTPSIDKLSADVFPFDACMVLTNEWGGSGGFSFQEIEQEGVSAKASVFRLESVNS